MPWVYRLQQRNVRRVMLTGVHDIIVCITEREYMSRSEKTKQPSALRGESALRCNPPISRGMIGRRGNGMIGCTASKQTCTGIPPPSIVILPGSLYCNVLEYSKWSG